MSSTLANRSWLLPGIPGVRVLEVESLPARLADAVRIGPGLEARPGAVLIAVPQIARYLITNAVAVEVLPVPRADAAAVGLFLDGPARAAVIHQRGELPLLSTTVVSPEGRCVAICGATGIGKSGVAAVLSRRGWTLVGEGVTRIALSGSHVYAHPSHQALRLWRDTCDTLGIDPTEMRRVRRQLEKFFVPVKNATEPVRLSVIAHLRSDPKVGGPEPVDPTRPLVAAYKPALAAALGNTERYEKIANAIVDECTYVVIDGGHSESLDALADHVEQALT